LITRIIFGKYWSLSSSLCSFLLPSYFVPLRPKYFPQHPILKLPVFSTEVCSTRGNV
jgi:hypothetical protein